MSWRQSYSFEPEREFLLRLLGIDANKMLNDAIEREKRAQGVEVRFEPVVDAPALDEFYTPPPVRATVVRADDATEVYVHKVVHRTRYDDEGHDHYEFVLESETPQVTTVYPEDSDG